MTDETKKLFDAPWEAVNHMHIVSRSDDPIGATCDEHNTHRFARLPELYDALVYFVHKSCSSANIDRCPNQGAGWIGCRDCSLMPYIELLRKVRNGE